MSRYTAVHFIQTEDGGIRISASGLPNCNSVTYADLSAPQKLAARLMVYAERLITETTDDLEEENREVA